MAVQFYDHLIAVVVVSVLFVAAMVAVPNISYVNLLHMNQQQLRNVALATLKTMLLNVGYPAAWASSTEFNAGSVDRFGLALDISSSLYVLDPDKVQRLVDDNPLGYLEYDQVRELLGLQGYGFSLKIRAPFKVDIEDQSPSGIENLRYEVTVTSNDGKPIPNAIVNTHIFYSEYKGIENENEKYSVEYIEETSYTDEVGKFTLEKVLSSDISDVIIIFKISVGDVHYVSTVYRRWSRPVDVAEINVVNNTVIVTPPDVKLKDARMILNIFTYSSSEITSLYTGTKDDKINWGERDRWEKTFNTFKETDPVITIFHFSAVEKGVGRKGILVVGPYPNYLGSRIEEFGEGSLSDVSVGVGVSVGVHLQRAVSISGMTYIAELNLWEE